MCILMLSLELREWMVNSDINILLGHIRFTVTNVGIDGEDFK
jgi:hypothetical protein